MAILGTASAAAIVTFAFDAEPASVARDQPELGRTAPPAAPSAMRAHPGLAIASDRVRTAASGAQRTPSALPRADDRRDLPFLAVLQQTPTEPAAPRVSEARVAPASRAAAAAREPLAAAAGLPRSSDPVCVVGCVAEPTTGLVSAATPDAAPGRAGVPGVAGSEPAPGNLPIGEGLIDPGAGTVEADALADSSLLADAGPSPAVAPSGELIAVAGNASVAEAPAAQVDVSQPDSLAGPEPEAASLSDAAPQPGVVDTAAESGSPNTISHHLARIGERYSAPAPDAPPPGAVAQADPAPPAPAPAAGATAVAVSIGQSDSASVIVQDDELVAIRLGELVSLLEHRFDHPLYVWIKSSGAASKFVTGETLAAAGISTRYDAEKDQIVLSTTGD